MDEHHEHSASGDLGADEVQEKMDNDLEQGYRGSTPDPTPNEAYTVAGVTSGEPTPETDAELSEKADDAAGIGDPLSMQAAEDRATAEAASNPGGMPGYGSTEGVQSNRDSGEESQS